ncbi:MAG: hypothetical protein FIB01_08760 [Gemmatimonadetes bacterium]|nr:hypothetical protein [Gemmatimonadota bacterium]
MVRGRCRAAGVRRQVAVAALAARAALPAHGQAQLPAHAQAPRIYWGDSVPAGWRGEWPAELQTVAERSGFTRTIATLGLQEYINTLKWRSEHLHVLNMFISPLRKAAPAIVLASPRVTSPQQAKESGKPVVFLMGNIHPSEPEAAEALLLVARDILLGRRGHLLDNQIVIIAPIFNVDGTDTFVTQDGSVGSETPHIVGVRENAAGLDLNRDAVKLQTVELNGLYRLLNAWDPVLLFDGHLMGRVTHGYANTYGTTTVPAAAVGPRDYTHDTLFPAVREAVRRDFGLEVFTHALFTPSDWPPTAWSHDRAAWTVDAKFVVNDYGLRNRLAIITETPGHPTFERRVYAQYAYILSLLEYTNAHAKEIQAVVKTADDETVARVTTLAESGQLRNFLDGEYRSRGKIDVLGYRANVPEYRPGTSVRGTRPGAVDGPPESVRVDDLTLPAGTRDAVVPRAYLIPAELSEVVEKLRAHNIAVRVLDKPMRAEGERFVIERMRKVRSSGYDMTVLDGVFAPLATEEFPAGTYLVDMAQPMANAAFYYLEPQARDGFVGWGLLDERLRALPLDRGPARYPLFKMRREAR